MPSESASIWLVIVAALETVLTSGVVFGWAPLQLMLEEEGVYSELCVNGAPCKEQAERLSMIYTMATSAFCFCVWPTGLVLDRVGPQACCILGAVLFGVGTVLFGASSSAAGGLDLFLPGYIGMAVGGLPIMLSMMHLSNLLPLYAGTIITVLQVMIDVSALDFKVFAELVANAGATRKQLFLGYTGVPILILLSAPLLWPKTKYPPRPSHLRQAEGNAVEGGGGTSVGGRLVGKSYKEQLLSWEFGLCVAFTAVHLLHINFYLCSVDDQIRFLDFTNSSSPFTLSHTTSSVHAVSPTGLTPFQLFAASPSRNKALVSGLESLFAWILPLGGLAFALPVGYTLDNCPVWKAVLLLSLASLLHSALAVYPDPIAQVVNFVAFAYYRAACFGTMAAVVVFSCGHDNFGMLWGVLYAVSGLLNLTIAPLVYLSTTVNESYLPTNEAMGSVCAALFAYPLWLWLQDNNQAAQDRKEAPLHERESLLGPNGGV